jgi:hypothetical protein
MEHPRGWAASHPQAPACFMLARGWHLGDDTDDVPIANGSVDLLGHGLGTSRIKRWWDPRFPGALSRSTGGHDSPTADQPVRE